MLTPRLTNCAQCEDICSLIESIDCKVAEMSVSLYNNVVFMLNKSFNHELLSDLLNYKRILQYKVCNPNYAGCFTVNMIASKVRRFTSGCIKDCSCRISSAETTTTTSTIPPSTTSTTTIAPPTTTTSTTISPWLCECITFVSYLFPSIYYYTDCSGVYVDGVLLAGQTIKVCGSDPGTTGDGAFSIGANCVGGTCPTSTTTTTSSSSTSTSTSTSSSTTTTSSSSSTTTTTTTIAPTTTTTTTVIYSAGFSVGTANNALACLETVAVITLYSTSPTFAFGSFVYTDPGLTTIFVGGNLSYKNISANNVIRVPDSGQINSTSSC